MGIRVKSTCDEMRGSVRAGSERRNARVKQAAGLHFRPVFLKKISRSDVLIERAGLKL
jgi:hypothetical protein